MMKWSQKTDLVKISDEHLNVNDLVTTLNFEEIYLFVCLLTSPI